MNTWASITKQISDKLVATVLEGKGIADNIPASLHSQVKDLVENRIADIRHDTINLIIAYNTGRNKEPGTPHSTKPVKKITAEDPIHSNTLHITEEVAGYPHHYHLSYYSQVPLSNTTSLCNLKVTPTVIPIHTWGCISSLGEKYCTECKKISNFIRDPTSLYP